MKYSLYIVLFAAFAAAAMASPSTCTGHTTTSDATFYQNMVLGGRDVSVYKTDSTTPLCDYQDFCERQGMNWYAPQSGAEADDTLNAMRAIDNYHTWVISKAPTLISGDGGPSWNGQPLTQIDSPGCMRSSTTEFSAIRDWGCSFCDPAQYSTSSCWDRNHQYDWIICEGTYEGGQNDVPEFGLIGAALVLIGAAIIVFRRKK